MTGSNLDRRTFLGSAPLALAAPGVGGIRLDPKPLFDISPYLYMQFMEPLGVTDISVEGAWDWDADNWRKDFVEVVADLAPDVIRWGGIYMQYYKWREAVGPAAKRPPVRNYTWGGRESNRAGTHEFVDLCRRTGAEPLWCVNFLSDGRERYWNRPGGLNRSGDAREAADWVSYCNDPDNQERRRNGAAEPFRVKLWQIGNETSYGKTGFTLEEAAAHTVDFAKAMRQRDPSIFLIGWGDRCGREGGRLWAGEMLKRAGEYLDSIAVHTMGQQSPKDPKAVIRSLAYQNQPERAWEELRQVSGQVEAFLEEVRSAVRAVDPRKKISVTEGHLSLMHNLNPILTEWLSGAYHARVMNIYQRHGDMVNLCTGADFEGNRWTVNAVMFTAWNSWLNPVGTVMRLFKRVNGKQAVRVMAAPPDLDIAASRTGNRFYLHVANLSYQRAVEAGFGIEGMTVSGGKVHEIAPENPREYVDMDRPRVFAPQEKALPAGVARWRFPARSVSAVELEARPA